MENKPSQDLENIVNVLKTNVEFCLDILKTRSIKDELQKALHDDRSLPDKKIAAAAAETINLLHEAERLLEPGHLVLADHFLGIYIRPEGFSSKE